MLLSLLHMCTVEEAAASSCTQGSGKQLLIVELALHPGEKVVHILRRRAFDGSFDGNAISPQVLEPEE